MYSLHYILMKAHINMHRSLSGRAAASREFDTLKAEKQL